MEKYPFFFKQSFLPSNHSDMPSNYLSLASIMLSFHPYNKKLSELSTEKAIRLETHCQFTTHHSAFLFSPQGRAITKTVFSNLHEDAKTWQLCFPHVIPLCVSHTNTQKNVTEKLFIQPATQGLDVGVNCLPLHFCCFWRGKLYF